MSNANRRTSTEEWTSVQAYTLAVVCLLVGLAGGWFFRGSQPVASAATASVANLSAPAGTTADQMPTPDQMKQMADTQAKPLVERLKSEPTNAELLVSVGNIYYDTQQYPTAIDYYQRALNVQPSNANVRTDLGTAYWYVGNPEKALEELNKALKYEPTKPNTLFNLGIVKWQGKMDVNGAVAAWQKLLDTNPSHEGKDKVQQLIAQAKKHTNIKPGTAAKPLAE